MLLAFFYAVFPGKLTHLSAGSPTLQTVLDRRES